MKLYLLLLVLAVFAYLVMEYAAKRKRQRQIKARLNRFSFSSQHSGKAPVTNKYLLQAQQYLLDYYHQYCYQYYKNMQSSEQGKELLKLALILAAVAMCLAWLYIDWLWLKVVAMLVLPLVIFVVCYQLWRKKELEQFELKLPNDIDVFARMIRSGVPVPQAIQNLGKEAGGLLAKEMQQVHQHSSIGMPLAQALEQSAKRVKVTEYQFFTIVLSLNQDAGGSLSETLSALTANIRRRQAVARKLLALTAEGRTSANIVLMIPAFLMLVQLYLSPEQVYFMLEDPSGKRILAYALACMAFGFLWIKRLSKL